MSITAGIEGARLRTSVSELAAALRAVAADEEAFAATLNLTANENLPSRAARAALLSPLGDRYLVGVWSDREPAEEEPSYVDEGLRLKAMPGAAALERLGAGAAREMFHAAYADFRPLSGMHAVLSALGLATEPGQLVYAFAPRTLGHHATQAVLEGMGRRVAHLPFDAGAMNIDLDALRERVRSAPPGAVFLDYGSPFYPLPVREVREIVGDRARIIYDGSHVLGLIAGGLFQDPLREGCDILLGNTHKTFPGPQKGILLYRDAALGRSIGDRLNVTAVSTQHTHQTLALLIAMAEMRAHGRAYAAQVLRNSRALSAALEARGFSLLALPGRPSETHMLAIRGPLPGGHHAACARLQRSGVNAQSKTILGAGVIRLGVQEPTRRGMREAQMEEVADLLADLLLKGLAEPAARERSEALARAYPGPAFTLDSELGT